MVTKYIPSRGDIVWLNFDPQYGKEIKKTRPALTVSPQKYNAKTSLALFMPITSKIKNYPFELILRDNKIKGAVLCDQIRSLDWQVRNAKFIDKIHDKLMQEILSRFKLLIE